MWAATHGEVDPAISLIDLAALVYHVYFYDLSYGVDYHQSGIGDVLLIADLIVSPIIDEGCR